MEWARKFKESFSIPNEVVNHQDAHHMLEKKITKKEATLIFFFDKISHDSKSINSEIQPTIMPPRINVIEEPIDQGKFTIGQPMKSNE